MPAHAPFHRWRGIAAALAAAWLALAAQAQTTAPDAQAAAARQEQSRLADADTSLALSAEGAALYERDAIKLSSGQYCSQAVALAETGEFRQSLRAASKALYLARRGNDENMLALANRDLAIAYNYAGQFDKAIEFARQALHYKARRPELVVAPARKVIGDVYLRRGDHAGAIASYEQALEAASERFAPLVQASLANALIESGSAANVERAAQLLPTIKLPADPVLASQIARTRARLLLAQGKNAEARAAYLRLTESASGPDAGYLRLWAWDGVARVDLALGNKTAAAESTARALANVDAVRARFRSEEFKMGLFSDLQSVFDRAVALNTDLNRTREAFEWSERSRARALLDVVRGRAAISSGETAAASLASLQNMLAADERVIVFHALPERLVVWSIGPQSLDTHTVQTGREELGELVETFRDSVMRGSRNAIGNAGKLGAALLGPLNLVAGQRLVIVPHGPLHYLPFQALRVHERYLIEDHPIAIAPSASVAAQLAQNTPRAQARLVAFGDPRIDDAHELPGAIAEVNQLARLFPQNRLFTGAQATKEQLLLAAADAPLLHVAAHAQADVVDPLYSRILLAGEAGKPEMLEAHEIIGLSMPHTALVTLSACESGVGRVAQGDEVLGFPRAFLSAGAASLLASLWPVSDDAAELLMSTLYGELAQGRDVQRALQAGQLAVLRQPGMEHPFYWAPFNLIGDWRLTVGSAQ